MLVLKFQKPVRGQPTRPALKHTKTTGRTGHLAAASVVDIICFVKYQAHKIVYNTVIDTYEVPLKSSVRVAKVV